LLLAALAACISGFGASQLAWWGFGRRSLGFGRRGGLVRPHGEACLGLDGVEPVVSSQGEETLGNDRGRPRLKGNSRVHVLVDVRMLAHEFLELWLRR